MISFSYVKETVGGFQRITVKKDQRTGKRSVHTRYYHPTDFQKTVIVAADGELEKVILESQAGISEIHLNGVQK